MFEAGHPYKGIGEAGVRSRGHCSADIEDWAQIMVEETMIDGVVVLGSPYISVCADAEELDGAQAAEVIDALQIARGRLHDILWAGFQVTNACPPWCTRRTHGDEIASGMPLVHGTHPLGELQATETPSGWVAVDIEQWADRPPMVNLTSSDSYLTRDETIKLATILLSAVAKLDEINAGS